MTPERRSVGLTGLGHMGSRIASKLLEAGHEVHVWDRGREAARELEAKGARAAETPTELASRVETAFSVLENDEAVREVVIDSGLLASLPVGAVFADLSTTSIDLALALANEGPELGVDV